MKRFRRRPSPALVVSIIALVVAMAGTAVAVNKVTSKEIKKNAVRSKHIKKNAVRTADIKDGDVASVDLQDGGVTNVDLAADAVDGSKVANNSLSDADLSDYEVVGNSFVKVTATDGATAAAAQAAAPETALFSKGPFEIYAKCFRDAGADTTHAEIYSRTSADGSIQEGFDDLPGGNAFADFLNTGTLEADRVLDDEIATGNDANYDESEWTLAAPDGTALNGLFDVGAKNGDLAGGNGLYGGGNVCIFQGSING